MSEGNRGRVLLGLCALLFASAARVDAAGTNANTDPPINVNDGKPRWRWIGERVDKSMPCPRGPLPQSWTIKPLFCVPQDPDDPDGACSDAPIPPGLLPFCAYEYTPATTVPQTDIDNLKALVPGSLTRVAQDSMAVSSAASGLQDETWQALFTHFKEEAGRVSGPPVPLEPLSTRLVRLAVIDTQPTASVGPDLMDHNSPHGHALANLAEELLCNNSGNCAATLTSRLALGYVCLDRKVNQPSCRGDPDLGGWIGTIGHLARAIRLEVRDWLDAGVLGRRLVLNLSVAWHPRFGGLQSNLNSMPSPVRAVYAAIADAECRGAVAFAAAGNVTGGPESQSGPLLPAAWEQRRAPKMMDCQNRLGATPPDIFPPAGVADNRPLVYAAGGVRGDGTTLANARPSSEPSLVAYADHADADDALGPAASTVTLTGSSVAALVASSAAASTWFFADHLLPSPLKPFEVVDLVYDNGLPVYEDDGVTPREADFCVGGTTANPCPGAPPEVREVQICTPVDAIAGSATCPTVNPLDLPIVDSGFFPVALSSLSASLTDATCGSVSIVTIHYAPGPVPANPCPFAQYFSLMAEPWAATETQPPESPCPNCGTKAQSRTATPAAPTTLFVEIDDAQVWSLTDATLQCGDSLFSLTNSLSSNFPGGTLAPGDKVAITLDNTVTCAPGSPMLIYFRNENGESVVDAVVEGN